MGDNITERELALARSKVMSDCLGKSRMMENLNKEIEKLININRRSIRKFKKFEISFWPPKLSWEWEFPFKK